MFYMKVVFLLPLVVAIPFEERAEEIQDVIVRFVKLYKSGRVTQVWEMNEPSTSSAIVSKTTRHHIIPADILRESFLNMLSNREHWPFMVQMLNAALENLRHQESLINVQDICNAQNALDVFDARVADCDVNTDNFFESLEHLLAIFYWTPFNIYYGPAPNLRAPADPGNIRDNDYDSGFDVITHMFSEILEHMFKESEISDLTVKLYILLLYVYSKPIAAGKFKEISPTFDKSIENYVKYQLKVNPDTPEYDEELLKVKNDDDRTIILQLIWLTELDVIEACETCKDNARKSLSSDSNANYKCKVKKCPFYPGNKKYILTSNVECESIMQLAEFFKDFILPMILILLLKSCMSVPLQFTEKRNNHNDDNDDFDFNGKKFTNSTNPIVVNLKKMFYATENLDYEYKKYYNSSSSGQRRTENTLKQQDNLLRNLDSSVLYCLS